MLSLLLDTATERGLVALCKGVEVIHEIHLPFGLHNSKALFLELNNLFKITGIDKSSLQAVVCGQGPGSYTGMRVAAAAAQSLSFALQIPLIGVPTTMGFTPEAEGNFVAMIDAKISGVYLQRGCKTNGCIRFLSEPEVVALDDLQNLATIVTPKKEILMQKIKGDFVWEEKGLSARMLITGALEKKQGLALLYLRKTQAEIERLSQSRL